jgi:hypothetical protein
LPRRADGKKGIQSRAAIRPQAGTEQDFRVCGDFAGGISPQFSIIDLDAFAFSANQADLAWKAVAALLGV